MLLHGSLKRLAACESVGRAMLHMSRCVSRIPLAPRSAAPKTAGPGQRHVEVRAAADSKPRSNPDKPPLPDTFQQLGVSPPLLEALAAQNITTPTEIQALALPALQSGADHLLASHTGSGKTLAYLLPLVQRLKDQEAAAAKTQQQQQGKVPGASSSTPSGEGDEGEAATGSSSSSTGGGWVGRPRRPRLLVVGPTKELAAQIAQVAKALSHHAKFRATCVSAATRMSQQKAALAGPIDVLVATPGRLLQHAEAGNVALGDVCALVVDEADTMFDQGFGPELKRLLKAVKGKPQPAQVVLVSATMTKAVRALVEDQLPGVTRLESSRFHRGVANARHVFSSIPPGRDKLDLLAEVIMRDVARRSRVLVFCGSVDSCRAAHHYLTDRDVPAACYHGDMPIPLRKEAWDAFAGGDPAAPTVMVATDLAARGLDFAGTIDHVVNFDFPGNPVDYLHRAGRTARAGAAGRITNLVGKYYKVLAHRIEWALQHDEPLDQLSAKKEVLPPSQRVKVTASKPARSSSTGREQRGSSSGGRKGSSGGVGTGASRRGAGRFVTAGTSATGPSAGAGKSGSRGSSSRGGSSSGGSSSGSRRGGSSSGGSSSGSRRGGSSGGGSGGKPLPSPPGSGRGGIKLKGRAGASRR